MRNPRTFTPKVFVPLFIATMGFAAFTNMASSPRFATFHTIDVVRLIASGMCFGAGPGCVAHLLRRVSLGLTRIPKAAVKVECNNVSALPCSVNAISRGMDQN